MAFPRRSLKRPFFSSAAAADGFLSSFEPDRSAPSWTVC